MTIFKTIWDNISTIKGQRNMLAIALIATIFFLRGCDGDTMDIDNFKNEQKIHLKCDSTTGTERHGEYLW